MGVLREDQLKRLKNDHVYRCQGVSMTEPTMRRFWRYLVTMVPMSWADNAITVSGLVVNILTTLSVIVYSADARQQVPACTLFLCAAGVFTYQTFDALDGEVWRRTGRGTVAENFDHGIDAVSTVFLIVGVCINLQLGSSPSMMFAVCFTTMMGCYVVHWQNYSTGIMLFQKIDVTEGQFMIIGIHLASGIFGQSLWDKQVPFVGVELRLVIAFMNLFGILGGIRTHLYFIYRQRMGDKHGVTVSGTSLLAPIVPMLLLMTSAVLIWQLSPSRLFENHPVLFTLTFGIAAAKLSNKLITVHMTKSNMDIVDVTLIGPLVMLVSILLNSPISEYVVLSATCVYCTIDLLHYFIRICQEIASYMDEYCFTVKPEYLTITSNDKKSL